MEIVWQVVYLLLWLLRLLILGRIVFDVVRMFAKSWRPIGAGAVALEVLYATTDPVIKPLRRLIPPLRLGGVGFDLSVIVLLLVVGILLSVVGNQL